MKRKRNVSFASRLMRRIILVIAFVTALAAGCTVWVAACSLPQDLQLPAEYAPALMEHLNRPVQVAWIIYDEATRQLSRYGTSGLYDFYLNELCQADGCSIESVSILVEVENWPICRFDNHFNHYIATVAIDDFTTIKPEREIEMIRASWGSHEQSYSRFTAELNRERNYARHIIRTSDRIRNEVVRIEYNRYFGLWFPETKWYTRWKVAD